MENNKKRVCVCVLGDIGHSPRMQYHSLSLAQSGFSVDIVGYLDLPKILNYIFKAFIQLLCLLFTLCFKVKSPTHILVQNPPSIPALGAVWLICRLKGSYFVIDWHNYGYSILSLSLGSTHFFVKAYRFLEFFFGKLSDFDLCVSESMKQDLKKRIDKSAIVLYDRPYSFFKVLTLLDKHRFVSKLQSEYPEIDCSIPNETLFTSYNEVTGDVDSKKTSPILLVSSTSWTEDEDFQILLDSLYEFDRVYAEKLIPNNNAIKVVCAITGKGPLKSYYINKLTEYSFKHTKFLFPWLAPEDYPKMLASANLGVCLHKSSSSLDLPMKVVDMFGSRLPVCAFRYSSIPELVLENQNGLLFNDSEDLVKCLVKLFQDYPTNSRLKQYRSHLELNFCKLDWDINWRQNALPLFKK